MSRLRVGLGFDVHRLQKSSRSLVLAGVRIPCAWSIKAVSDGDVVLHAVADSILGAACLGDIGDYFAPSAPSSRGLNSSVIVKKVLEKCKKRYTLVNVDVTILAEKPRLVQHKRAMKQSLAKLLKTKAVNIKIKSKEGLDILGAKDAISCIAFTLLEQCSKSTTP